MTVSLSYPAHATSGSFSIFTYNIAGLPQVLSSATSDRQDATERISCMCSSGPAMAATGRRARIVDVPLLIPGPSVGEEYGT